MQKRIKHPFIKNATCIEVKTKCTCSCHYNPSIIHFVACCNFGWITTYTDIIKK